MCHWIPSANLFIQLLILVFLIWYACETYRLRKASQEQIEALQKPCLTVATTARDYDEAILEINGAVGGMVLAPREGSVQLRNIGAGPAFNIRYKFNCLDQPQQDGAVVVEPSGYLPYITAGDKFAMQVTRGILQLHEYQLVALYDSLSGRRYETKITINNLVLTTVQFRPFEG
jgi:hypothetical protein